MTTAYAHAQLDELAKGTTPVTVERIDAIRAAMIATDDGSPGLLETLDVLAQGRLAVELREDPRLSVPLDGPGSHRSDLRELRTVQAERDRLRSEVAALTARVEALAGALRVSEAVIEALPRCCETDGEGTDDERDCAALAMVGWSDTDEATHCDRHGRESPSDMFDVTWATPLRAYLAAKEPTDG